MFFLVFIFVVVSAHFNINDHFSLADEPRYWTNNMQDYVTGDSPTISDKTRQKMIHQFDNYTTNVMQMMWPPGSEEGDANSWDCYGGSCGAAMVFYKLSLKSKSSWLDVAASFIDYSLAQLKDSNAIGFLRGANGVYAMCALIHRTKNVSQSNWCIQQLNQSVFIVSQSPIDKYWDELDFGRAGLIMAVLSITESGFWPKDIIPRDQILTVAHQLFQKGVETGTNGILAWKTGTQPYTMWGQNHGSTGILMQFFRLPELFANQTIDNYVKNTIDYFLTLQFPSGNFPTPLQPPYPSQPDILIQWCHGGPAFIPVLGEAYLRYKDERYYLSMEKALDNMWEKGILTKGLMLCHGISGNTYMFFYGFRIKGDLKHLYRASKFQEFVLDTPQLCEPGVMVQNYPWVFYGSSYLSAMTLWSDFLNANVDYKAMHMPGFAIEW